LLGVNIGGGLVFGAVAGAYSGIDNANRAGASGSEMFEAGLMGFSQGAILCTVSGAAGGAVGSLWSPSTFGGMLLNSAAGGAAGKQGYAKGSPDFFDSESFIEGKQSPYLNPRTSNFNFSTAPIYGSFDWTDPLLYLYIFSFL